LVFYFGLFLPLVFITACFSLDKKEQLFNSLFVSVSILFVYYTGLLLNRSFEILNFLDFEKIPYLNGFESSFTIATLWVFLLGFMLGAILFKKNFLETLTPWSLANIYLCFFLITLTVASENLLVFLFACESFVWLNLSKIRLQKYSIKSIYFQSYLSTCLLLVLTIFLGLLESISLSEMTYGLENLSRISLSFVSGTIYSTQTLFFIMALLYVALKLSLLLKVIALKVLETELSWATFLMIVLGLPALLFCFYNQQVRFYDLACKEYGVVGLIGLVLTVIIIQVLSFKNYIKPWSQNG